MGRLSGPRDLSAPVAAGALAQLTRLRCVRLGCLWTLSLACTTGLLPTCFLGPRERMGGAQGCVAMFPRRISGCKRLKVTDASWCALPSLLVRPPAGWRGWLQRPH